MNMIKEIQGFTGYFISTDGKVYSNKKKIKLEGARAGFTWVETDSLRELKQSMRRGYLRVSLWDNEKRNYKSSPVHRVIMETFDPKPNEKLLVCHFNNDPLDNRIENLYWGTTQENSAQMVRDGRSLKGGSNPHAKLTEANVRLMKARFNEGLERKDIAEEFGVAISTVDNIKYNRNWKHITI